MEYNNKEIHFEFNLKVSTIYFLVALGFFLISAFCMGYAYYTFKVDMFNDLVIDGNITTSLINFGFTIAFIVKGIYTKYKEI